MRSVRGDQNILHLGPQVLNSHYMHGHWRSGAILLVDLRIYDKVLSRTMNIESLKARAVVEICGFGSVAMLDYLERSGVFIPEVKRQKNRGRVRSYTFKDVLTLKLLSTLLKNGASVSALKDALNMLHRVKWKAEETVLEDSRGALRHLILSAGKVYFARNREELIDLATGGQLTFSFMIDLDRLHTSLQSEWRQSRIKLRS